MRKLAAPALLAAVLAQPSAASAGILIRTDSGPVRGAARQGISFFGAIPYAAPPIGARRWRAPAPARAWTRVRDASGFGADCPQPSLGRGEEPLAPQSEDCLTLNIATPDISARKLPVLVLIHGGAYFVGSGRQLFARGMPSIVRRGVVLVAPNYRLGWLGFFAHPALTREAPAATANYWLMDQVAALQWVRRNIARFGGDPKNVTIMGCSAGGSSVNALVASPKSRNLFARASAHSGGGLFNANRPLSAAEQQGLGFAGRVGVPGTGLEALARLRRLNVAEVLRGDSGAPDFGAVVDGHWLESPIAIVFARSRIARVPLLTGSTSNEASVFGLMGFGRETLEQRFKLNFRTLARAYGPLAAEELLRQVQTDFIFTAPAMAMTQLTARAGLPAWSYHFDYVDSARRGQMPGANHCDDMPYWLGQLERPSAEDQRISATMQDYFLNFVRSGDPNAVGLPAWPPVKPGTAAPLLIDGRFQLAPDFRARQLAPYYAKWQSETGQSLGFVSR